MQLRYPFNPRLSSLLYFGVDTLLLVGYDALATVIVPLHMLNSFLLVLPLTPRSLSNILSLSLPKAAAPSRSPDPKGITNKTRRASRTGAWIT